MNDSILFAQKYRIPSARLRGWDYAGKGAYFVTICTHNREPWFGLIRNHAMVRSDVGNVVADEWLQTGIVRPNIAFDEWVVMPDHMHGIIIIRKSVNPNIINNPYHHLEWGPGTIGSIIQQF